MLTIDNLLESLTLVADGDDRYHAGNAEVGPGVIFGGQLLAQSIVAAVATEPDKYVKTVHTIFARAGSPETQVEITVDRMHSGRAMASRTVTIGQGDRLIARSQLLLTADEPSFIHHADAAPSAAGPHDSRATREGEDAGAWEVRIGGDADVNDPEYVGRPELDVWTRFVGAPDDLTISQGLLAFATDGFLIGAAMLPHDGVGQAQAHHTLSTGVLSHTLTFHEPFRASDWLLLAHHSTYAGHGRAYGRADVFTEDGRLVASFVQDSMIRPMPAGSVL
jgi:acyl-CoA thioesterase